MDQRKCKHKWLKLNYIDDKPTIIKCKICNRTSLINKTPNKRQKAKGCFGKVNNQPRINKAVVLKMPKLSIGAKTT